MKNPNTDSVTNTNSAILQFFAAEDSYCCTAEKALYHLLQRMWALYNAQELKKNEAARKEAERTRAAFVLVSETRKRLNEKLKELYYEAQTITKTNKNSQIK